MLRTMAELLEEVCSVTRRLLRRGLGLQTSRHVNVFFPAKGRILFEQASYKKFVTFSKPFSYVDFVLFSQYLLPDQLSY